MTHHGRIDAQLPSTTTEEVLDLVAQIRAKFPFLVHLENHEKYHLAKARAGINDVANTILDVQTDAGMPAGADDSLRTDLGVYNELTVVRDEVAELLTHIEDTRMQAGAEAWSECLVRYGMLRQRSRSMPALTGKLDRIQPLIYRSRRPAVKDDPAPESATQGDPAPEPATVPAD